MGEREGGREGGSIHAGQMESGITAVVLLIHICTTVRQDSHQMIITTFDGCEKRREEKERKKKSQRIEEIRRDGRKSRRVCNKGIYIYIPK